MGILLNLTKEYFGETEREEDKLPMLDEPPEGVEIHDFTDMNGKRHKEGYYIPSGKKVHLAYLIARLIDLRGFDCNLNDIDVSNIKDMSGLFSPYEDFQGDVSGWNTSSCINMKSLFSGCAHFNCNLNKWNVSKVKNFEKMFYHCYNFNGDISDWKLNTKKVPKGSPSYKQSTIVTDNMFEDCHRFNCDISKWDVSNIISAYHMIAWCVDFHQDLSGWNLAYKNEEIVYACVKMTDDLMPKH